MWLFDFKEMIYFMRTNPNDASLEGIIRPLHFAALDESPKPADVVRADGANFTVRRGRVFEAMISRDPAAERASEHVS